MAQGYNPPGMWAPNGRAFQQGVVAHEGRTLHITGQVAWDADGRIVGPNDAERQMEETIANIRRVLEPVGGRLEDIVSMTIYFLRHQDLPAIQAVRARHFPAETAPASILIQVPGLVVPGLLLELVPIAVVPHARFRAPAFS